MILPKNHFAGSLNSFNLNVHPAFDMLLVLLNPQTCDTTILYNIEIIYLSRQYTD